MTPRVLLQDDIFASASSSTQEYFLILSYVYRNGIAHYVVLLALNLREGSIIFAFFFPPNIHFVHPLSWCSHQTAGLNSTLRYVGDIGRSYWPLRATDTMFYLTDMY